MDLDDWEAGDRWQEIKHNRNEESIAPGILDNFYSCQGSVEVSRSKVKQSVLYQ